MEGGLIMCMHQPERHSDKCKDCDEIKTGGYLGGNYEDYRAKWWCKRYNDFCYKVARNCLKQPKTTPQGEKGEG